MLKNICLNTSKIRTLNNEIINQMETLSEKLVRTIATVHLPCVFFVQQRNLNRNKFWHISMAVEPF